MHENKINIMRIVLDFRIFGPERGGLGRYNEKLLLNLVKLDLVNEYIVLLYDENYKLTLPKNFKIKIVKYRWYSVAEQIFLPFILYRLKPDLVHFPHFNVPVLYRGKYIITIHDLIMSHFPSIKTSTLGRLAFIIKRLAYNITIKNAVQKAEKIIAVSEFTKQDITKYFKLSEERTKAISVIYEGVSASAMGQSVSVKLPEKFFLYVGVAFPHKNLDFLVDSFAEFIKFYPEYYLILVGNRNYFYNQLENYIKLNHHDIQAKIIYKGFVPDSELGAYFSQATAFVFPSLYEGFGLPPLEAMQFGTVVVASRSSCLPEILQDSALFFDPRNKQDLVNKLEIIIKNSELKNKLIARGEELVKKYSWEDMARQIVKIYAE
jgi:glycosyltransferase involved in cell wall biosynthesis